MGHYLINFAAYTLAMVGLIFLCLLVYKKSVMDGQKGTSAEFLAVENRLSLSPRKSLYVVKAGNEKFLIAADVDKTTFLAKLGEETKDMSAISAFHKAANVADLKSSAARLHKRTSLAGLSIDEELVGASASNVTKMPVMKELMRKLNAQRG